MSVPTYCLKETLFVYYTVFEDGWKAYRGPSWEYNVKPLFISITALIMTLKITFYFVINEILKSFKNQGPDIWIS